VLAVRAAALALAAICFPTILQIVSDLMSILVQIGSSPSLATGGVLDELTTSVDPQWLRRMLILRSAAIIGFVGGLLVPRLSPRSILKVLSLASAGAPP
jgi:hypothetical protein